MPRTLVPLLVIIVTQLLFTVSDLVARAHMRGRPFTFATFLAGWFLVYFLIRQVAMFGQLYVFTAMPVGRTMALFGATSIVIVNILGVLFLQEVLSTRAYIGVGLAVLAFVALALGR